MRCDRSICLPTRASARREVRDRDSILTANTIMPVVGVGDVGVARAAARLVLSVDGLWTHLPHLPLWPRPPPRNDPPPLPFPGHPRPQPRHEPPLPHRRFHHRLGRLENEQITHLLRTFTLPLPQENYSSGNLASTPRKHSQSCFKIHSATLSTITPISQDHRSAPATGRSTPHKFTFSDAPMMG